MSRRRSLTSTLYRAARLSNDLRNARRGPVPLGKRLVRKRVYRRTGGSTRRLLRALGLSR